MAVSIMLAATTAFLVQTTAAAAARMAASLGSAPHPAVTVNGPLHLHGQLAKIVHFHGGDTTPGHVHDHHDSEDGGTGQFWSLGCVTAVIPATGSAAVLLDVQMPITGWTRDRLEGIEPDGLQRPPSTPGIA